MAGDVVEDVISAPNKDFRLPGEGMMSASDKDFGLSNQGLMSMSNEGLMGDEKRFRLEDFSLLTTIGTGTFARVCLCQEEHTRDYYALKVMAKHDLVRQKQVAHVKSEKSILEQVNHPFLLELLWSHQDSSFLYMLFPYVVGGELFSYLRRAGNFPAATTLFYSAEIVSALEYLHSLCIIYRDLKPENLLLDSDGHLKIIDFGFAKRVTDRTWTLCGTPEYLAPEIIQARGHNKAVDWWALGILLYEMLVGYPPFFDSNPFGLYEKILLNKVVWPRNPVDPLARNLVTRLLVLDANKRLGNLRNGAQDVKKHRFFKTIDWEGVRSKELKPPIVPKFGFSGDTRNFEEYAETDWINVPEASAKEERLFRDF